jgi:hypothetical protein
MDGRVIVDEEHLILVKAINVLRTCGVSALRDDAT